MTPYSHTQSGWLTVLSLGIPAIGCVVAFLFVPSPFDFIPLGVAVLFVILSLLFYSMRIQVDEHEIRMSMGPGVISKSWPISEAMSARHVKTKLIDGWGIHLTTNGWLYNVNIPHAVHITFNKGKGVLLGTDEPTELLEALAQAGVEVEQD